MKLTATHNFPLLLLLLLASTARAGTFDSTAQGAAAVPVDRILNCNLTKTSFKGDNEGWLSSADKSVESTCLAGDKPIKFSATADKWPELLKMAGQAVVVKLARNNGLAKDAKTDWVMLELAPKRAAQPTMEKLCGDDKAAKEIEKVWSHGYRVGEAVDVWVGGSRDKDDHWSGPQKGHKDDWYLDVRMSLARNWQWAPGGSVRLGAVCADSYSAVAAATEPLVFVYDQGSEDPEYTIVEIYKMK
jgi:hypothetical protein